MGISLGDLIAKRKIGLQELSGRNLAVDAYNMIYQFLSIIRGIDGSHLVDKDGMVTSHLSGLLYRNINLIEYGIFPAYVFDGEPPRLKRVEIERREEVKREARVKYRKALQEGKLEEAKIYAQGTSRLTQAMLEDAQRLLSLMGIPWVQAPSEGEAQAAYMARRGDVWAAASQDYDAILFGSPTLVRNITISGRRKLPRKNAYIEVEPEVIELKRLLEELDLDLGQLITVGILIGTDYNPDGIPGVGPKTALRLVKRYSTLDEIRKHLEDSAAFPVNPNELMELFLNPQITNNYELHWHEPDVEGVMSFLCEERDFSEDRVSKAMEKMIVGFTKTQTRSTLERWFT